MAELTPDDRRLLAYLTNGDASEQRAEQDEGRHRTLPPRPRPRPDKKSRSPARPRPDSLAGRLLAAEPSLGAELASRLAARWAEALLITPGELSAWLAAGIKYNEIALVLDLRAEGVPPEALGWIVRRASMLDRIRHRRYSAAQVAETLRNEGRLS
jgi:hypothetical protein